MKSGSSPTSTNNSAPSIPTSSKVSSANKLPVVVIGAGVAGLYAAHLLQHVHNVKVVVVEASKVVGGRVLQERLWNRDFDLGAEFLHGGNTILRELVEKLELKHHEVFCIPERPGNAWLYLGRERKLLPYDTKDKDITRMKNVLSPGDAHGQRGEDVSLLKYLANQDLPYRILGLADSLYAKTWCTDIHTLGIQEYFRTEQRWEERNYGRDNLRVEQSFRPVLEYLKKDLTIRTEWQVKEVNFTDIDSIAVKNQNGEIIRATRVIVAVPLTVMQDRDIKFIPALPEEKNTAARSLQMDPAIKILLKFSKKFWPSNHGLVVCSDSFVSQYWTYEADSAAPPVICGFCTGDQARNVGSMSHDVIVDSFLKQLDAIYASQQNGVAPATSNYQEYYIYDWGKNPFIRGGYSAGKVGANVLHRQLLGQNVASYVFFCGEATSSFAPGTVHGAMESAALAVDELIAFKRQKKTLLAKKRSKMDKLQAPAPTAKM